MNMMGIDMDLQTGAVDLPDQVCVFLDGIHPVDDIEIHRLKRENSLPLFGIFANLLQARKEPVVIQVILGWIDVAL